MSIYTRVVALRQISRQTIRLCCAIAFGLGALGCQAQNIGTKMTQETPSATISHYGYLSDQTEVKQVTLANRNGMSVNILSYGGIITHIMAPDKDGAFTNIVLGMDAISDYETSNPYYGAIIGRFGNRIANGRFTLNGVEYQLAKNDGDNHLHGGVYGFDRKNWTLAPYSTAHSAGVKLSLISPDGDQGYPGELAIEVDYTLTDNNTLEMTFNATTNKTTVVNMTQHSYFNLAGQGSILDHQLTIPSAHITPVDDGLIPTGELMAVKGTAFDFGTAKAIGKDIDVQHEQLIKGKGYDHNYVLKNEIDEQLIMAAKVVEPNSGRMLTVYTDEPAVQFYSGNFMDGTTSRDGKPFEYRTGFCLEPQHYPDAPNQAHFPTTTLMPGELYQARIVYAFGIEK